MNNQKIIKLSINKELNGHEIRNLVSTYADFKNFLVNSRDYKEITESLLRFSNYVYQLMTSYTKNPIRTIKLFPETSN